MPIPRALARLQFNIYVDPDLLATAKKVAATVKLSRSYTVPGSNTTFTLDTIPKIKASRRVYTVQGRTAGCSRLGNWPFWCMH